MGRRLKSPSAGSTVVDKLKAYEGGTGQTTAVAALAALNGVAASSLNQPNGVAGLDSTTKIPAANLPLDNMSVVAVTGPASVSINNVGVYKISNFDNFTPYNLAAISGSVSILNDTITYVAPGATGSGGFTINGRSYAVSIVPYAPNVPVLTGYSLYGGTNLAALQLTGSAYSVNGGSNAQLNTDWQVATDANFNTIVSSSMADATNKTTWKSGTLNLNTQYYARLRYRDSAGNTSDWSNTLSIVTKSTYAFNVEEAILTASDKTSNAQFGSGVASSADGSRVVVGAWQSISGGISQAGQAYVFLRTGTTWTQEQILFASDRVANALFGFGMAMNSDATRIVIGAAQATSGGITTAGQAYVFTRSGTVWTQEAILFASDRASNSNFAWSVSMTNDATRCIIGARNATSNSIANAGQSYIYLRTGTSWAQEQILFASDRATYGTTGVFGHCVHINSDATRCIVGAATANSGGLSQAGQAYVFVRSGTVWTQEALFAASDRTASSVYGVSVCLSIDTTRAAVGAYQATSGGFAAAGQVYIYLRTGTSWAQEALLYASDRAANGWFGVTLTMNGDGTRLVVGARQAASGGFAQAGQAYDFTRAGTNWVQSSILYASDRGTGFLFSYQLNMVQDGTRLVSAAFNSTQGGVTGAGSVYIERTA